MVMLAIRQQRIRFDDDQIIIIIFIIEASCAHEQLSHPPVYPVLHKYCVCNGRDTNCPYSASIAKSGIHQLWTPRHMSKANDASFQVPYKSMSVLIHTTNWLCQTEFSQRSHEKSCDIWCTVEHFQWLPRYIFDI